MIDLETETTERTQTEQTSRWRSSAPLVRWAAALALVVGAAGVVFFATRDDAPTIVAGPDPEAVLDQYFAAFNAGDADAVVSLLAPEVTLTERFGAVGDFEVFSRPDWEEEITEFVAQGAVFTTQSCTEADDQPTRDRTVSCDYGLLDAPSQAVGAPPIPVTTRFTVTPLGKISEVQVTYDSANTSIDFVHVGRPFGQWLQTNHPDFADLAATDQPVASCCESMSATERGTLKAHYAQEWAAYLEANDCTYLDGC
jgi:hypothetical protein